MKDRIGITGSSGSLGKIIKKNFKKKYNFFYFKGDITKKKQVQNWKKKKKYKCNYSFSSNSPN